MAADIRQQQSVDNQPTSQTETKPLDEVVARVRRDCETDSREYLDRAKVPHGGE